MQYREATTQGVEAGRVQAGEDDASRCSTEDASRPFAGEEAGRRSNEDAVWPVVEEETNGAALERPAGQAEKVSTSRSIGGPGTRRPRRLQRSWNRWKRCRRKRCQSGSRT